MKNVLFRLPLLCACLLTLQCGHSESVPPKVSKPNILWLMSDELRTDGLGAYGSSWARTPNLDRLAREGALFQVALTPGPVCVPARASILTGRYPSDIGIWWNIRSYAPNLSDLPVLEHLTEVFHKAGYRSASFGKRHYNSRNNAFQTEVHFALSDLVGYYRYTPPLEGADYGLIQFPDPRYKWIFGGRFPGSIEETAEARAVRLAIEWLEKSGDDPFLLRLSFNAPHTPVVPPAPFDTLIAEDDIHLPEAAETSPRNEPAWLKDTLRPICDATRLTSEQIRAARRYYYGEVAFLDSQIGRLLDWMKEHGKLENTVVVLVSDHGTHLGDYGLVAKQTFYEPVVNVPFIFWFPGQVKPGTILETPVETRSLLPTLIDLAGLELPAEKHNYAPSLAPSLRLAQEPDSRPVFSEETLASFDVLPDERLVLVREGDWKLSLALSPDPGQGALYNLSQDPYERKNLYGDPEAEDVQKHLTQLIQKHLEQGEAK